MSFTPRANIASWEGITCSSDGTKLFAVTYLSTYGNGRIYKSNDSGASWSESYNDPFILYWLDISCSSDGTKIVAVSDVYVYISNNSGLSWTISLSLANKQFWSVASSSDGVNLITAAYNGQIYTSNNSGLNWTARESNRNWLAVACSSDGTVLFATAENQGIFKSTNGGISWSKIPNTQTLSLETITFNDIACSSNGNKIVGITTGGIVSTISIYISNDGGTSWTISNLDGSASSSKSIAMSSDGSKLIASSYGGKIYTSTNGGTSWLLLENNKSWRDVTISSDGAVLAAVELGGQIYMNTVAAPTTTTTTTTAAPTTTTTTTTAAPTTTTTTTTAAPTCQIVTLSSINYNNQIADVTFYPQNNPVSQIRLGSQRIPYSFTSNNWYGRYSLYFPYFGSTCEASILQATTTTTTIEGTTQPPSTSTTQAPSVTSTTTTQSQQCIYISNVVSANATYSQSSVYYQNLPATTLSMNNRIFNETKYTGTNIGGLQWIKMDLGTTYNIRNILIGCDFNNTLEFGWGKSYTENLPIESSVNDINWITIGNTGTFSATCKTFNVNINARYIRITNSTTNSWIAATEFAAGI